MVFCKLLVFEYQSFYVRDVFHVKRIGSLAIEQRFT